MTIKSSNTIVRILSAAIALPVYVLAIYTDLFYGVPILVVSLIISLVTLYEFYAMSKVAQDKPLVLLGLLTGFVINLIIYFYAYGNKICQTVNYDFRLLIGMLVLLISIILIRQTLKGEISGSINVLSKVVFGNIYIVLFFAHIILMKSLTNGVFYIIILNIIVMLNDTAAFFGGSLLGKHKMKLKVSPNKTWEGYISGFIFSMLVMFICNEVCLAAWNVTLFGTGEALLLGAGLSVLGFLGDLVESLIKRDANVKDSGKIIPGHGGMWDAFDALVLTYPLFYYYLLLRG